MLIYHHNAVVDTLPDFGGEDCVSKKALFVSIFEQKVFVLTNMEEGADYIPSPKVSFTVMVTKLL